MTSSPCVKFVDILDVTYTMGNVTGISRSFQMKSLGMPRGGSIGKRARCRRAPRIAITRAAMASYVVQTDSPVVKRKGNQFLYLRPYPSQLLYTDRSMSI